MRYAPIACILGLILQLVSCANSGNMGSYSTSRLSSNIATVTFMGNTLDPSNKVKSGILAHCAKLALDSGYDYFVITSMKQVPLASFNNINLDRTMTYGIPTAINYNQGENFEAQNYKTVVTISLYRGAVPMNADNAYDARTVLKQKS